MIAIVQIVAMIIPYFLKLIDWGIKQGMLKEEAKKEYLKLLDQYNQSIKGQSQSISDEVKRQRQNLSN